MSLNAIQAVIGATLLTLIETEPEPAPESGFYLALGMNIDRWHLIKDILVTTELVTIKGHCLHLTTKGRELAVKIQASVEPASHS